MKTWDVIIVGAGIIGLSLALDLRRHGATVLVTDKSEPGREASHAAAGMLAHCEQSAPLRELATASAQLYPEFVRELEDESGLTIDYRTDGTILLRSGPEDEPSCPDALHLTPETLADLEPRLAFADDAALLLPEACVDPRSLIAALVKAARHRDIDIASGSEVTEIDTTNLGTAGVLTQKTRYPTAAVVNCAGAWSATFAAPLQPPTRPLKGHMLDVIPEQRLLSRSPGSSPPLLLRHVIRTPDIYLVPRTDGRIVIGSTVEEAGYDKRINPDTIQSLFQSAANVCPELGQAKIHETWTGLRPGTPDSLPILGPTPTPGYFIATGHFRDGILLAPITAKLMTDLIQGRQPDLDLSAFSPTRF